jgi:hypothetical protein
VSEAIDIEPRSPQNVCTALGGAITIEFRQRVSWHTMPEAFSATDDLSAPDYLISLLKAITDGRYLRGLRFPRWLLLLMEVLATLSAPAAAPPNAPSSMVAVG